MLEGGSNYECRPEGQIVIKYSGKFLRKGTSTEVLVLDENESVLNELEYINICAPHVGVSNPTIIRRLRYGKSIMWNSRLVYIKPKGK